MEPGSTGTGIPSSGGGVAAGDVDRRLEEDVRDCFEVENLEVVTDL